MSEQSEKETAKLAIMQQQDLIEERELRRWFKRTIVKTVCIVGGITAVLAVGAVTRPDTPVFTDESN